MTDKTSVDRSHQDGPRKKEYEPPAIEESGDFERLVLGCMHHPGEPEPCEDLGARS
jgi:hypothetical protein